MSMRTVGLLSCLGVVGWALTAGASAQEKKNPEPTGACVYSAATKIYCAVVSQANCATLKGSWSLGEKCR